MTNRLFAAAVLAILISGAAFAQDGEIRGPVYVGEPVVPVLTPALRDLPQYVEDPNLYGLEAKRRDDHGILVPDIDMPPHDNPLAELQLSRSPGPGLNAFGTPIVNFQGVTSGSSPPDDTGDVGPNHFLQGDNGSGGSRLTIYNKTGTQLGQYLMETLGSSPCNSGYCDPIVQYDELADRWMISEFDSSANVLCVYVSRTSDPLGQWWAYSFDMTAQGGMQDYPKYGVWPDGYYVGVNNGGYIHVLQRPAMLTGGPATSQTFLIPTLSGFGFQLTLPGTLEGDAPPAGAPAIFARPVDTEIHSGTWTCSPAPCDVMDLYAFHVDWVTPASSAVTHLPNVTMAEFDHTLCGTGSTWNCMPQPGTTQKIDPIREPIHFPLQYRNWGSYETLVGAFAEDVDGTDHAAVHWFELRKVSGTWSMYQEGVLGGEANIHRSIGSAAMDGSGNIAVGYTRTGTAAPYYPSIYYSGRLASDPLGTMPYYDNAIWDATTSKTDNERYGDYAGIGMDPTDDCTFWFTTEYGGSGQTRVASFKFDQCGCLAIPAAPTASASAPQDNRIDVGWNDSATASITRYWVYRSTVSGGPYTQIAEVPDSSPGVGSGAPYTYHDDTVSGGIRYYYVVKSNDGVSCTSPASGEVYADATGACTLAPAFAGIGSVTNPANSTCTLNLAWPSGTPICSGPLRYNIYRSTTPGFTPGAGNRIAQNLNTTSYSDLDNLVSGTSYYYIVRSVDTSNGVEEANTTEMTAKPTGPITTSNMTETFEAVGGFDNAGWTHQAVSGSVDWAWSTVQPQTPTHSWFSASQATTADRVLLSPQFGVLSNTVLSFWHTYAFESTTTCYDGGTLEITTDGGTNWSVIPDAAFTAGLFNGTASSGNPIAGKRAWCGGTVGAMTQVTVNLGSYAGENVRVRWHAGEDSSQAVTGWYIDSVTITNAGVAGSCATGSACANNPTVVDVTPNGPLTICAGSSQLLTCGATGGSGITYQWYDGSDPIPGATSSTYTAGTTGTHAYNCKVTGTICASGLSDASATSITWQTSPTFGGLASVTNPQSATCTLDLAWSDASSACPGTVTYKIYRSATTPVSIIPGNLIASGVTGTAYSDSGSLNSGTNYYYVVRAVDGASQEDANTVERSGTPTGTGGGPFTLLDENFEGTWGTYGDNPPTGWTIEDHGSQNPKIWDTNDWYRFSKGGAYGFIARVNYSPVENQDDWLITPAFNLPAGATTAALEFDHYFYVYSTPDEFGYVDFMSDQTPSWTNLTTYIATTGASSTYAHASLSLLAYSGQTNCKIRFRYVAQDDWYWEMDNVKVSGVVNNPCTTSVPVPGETAPGATLANSLHWTDGTTQAWPANAQATGYKIVRGTPAQLPDLLTASDDSCTRWTGATTTFTASEAPASGSLYWYLVIGTNAMGDGHAGYATAGPRLCTSTGACP